MAEALVRGAEGEGAEVKLIQVASATEDDVKDVDRIAFGCPAMGAEEIEGTGAKLIADGFAAYDDPDQDALEECEALGRDLARS